MSVKVTTQQQQTQAPNAQATGGRAKSAVSRFNTMFQAPVAFSKSGDALNKFHEAFTESLKKIQNHLVDKYTLLALDTSDISGAVQLIVLYAEIDGYVAFNSFILESTLRGALQDRTYKGSYGQPEIRIPTCVGDLYTQSMSDYVTSQIMKIKQVPKERIADAGAIVIYNELQPESEIHIHTLLWRATNSIQDLFNMRDPESERLNLAAYKDARFTGRMDFNPGQGETSSGLPVRRDVVISVEMSDMHSDSFDPAEFSQNSVQLVRVGGYLDMRYTGPRPFNPQMAQMGQYYSPTQIYQPTLFITDTNTVANQINLEMQLFALAEFTQLSRGHQKRWVNMLRPRYGAAPDIAKLRNFKGFQYEVGADIVSDPDAPNFNLLEETNKICHGSLAHVLLCETTADLSWIHTTFRMAAGGDVDAIEAIRNAADNLCNGHFSQNFPEGTPIAAIEADRVILGYWNTNNELRSLLDIDQLAILNLCGEQDMATVLDYTDTFNPAKGQTHERVARRIEILKNVFQGNIRITGTAVPVVLNPVFLAALANGISKAGVNVQYEETSAMLGSTDRSNLSLIQYALDPNALLMNSVNMQMGNQNYGLFAGNRYGGFGG